MPYSSERNYVLIVRADLTAGVAGFLSEHPDRPDPEAMLRIRLMSEVVGEVIESMLEWDAERLQAEVVRLTKMNQANKRNPPEPKEPT